MSSRKIVKIMLVGVAFAALVCVIAGICIYVPALNNIPSASAPNYSSLVEQRYSMLQIGMLIMMVGCVSFIVAFIAYAGMIVLTALNKSDKDTNGVEKDR